MLFFSLCLGYISDQNSEMALQEPLLSRCLFKDLLIFYFLFVFYLNVSM